ncbi:hypothetical protein PCANC_24542, partial [Puccinia coronata f. sp. avenae]
SPTPASTIKLELKARLLLTKKKAQTVHPAQCPIERAEYSSRMSAQFPSGLTLEIKHGRHGDAEPNDFVAH